MCENGGVVFSEGADSKKKESKNMSNLILDYGLEISDVFNDSHTPQTKQEYLDELEKRNNSKDFSEITNHNHEENTACLQRINKLLFEMREIS